MIYLNAIGLSFVTTTPSTASTNGKEEDKLRNLCLPQNTSKYLDATGNINETKLERDIIPLIKKITKTKDIYNTLYFANSLFIDTELDQKIREYVARKIIKAVHKKISLEKSQLLSQNVDQILKIFEGVPYNHGFVTAQGEIRLEHGEQEERGRRIKEHEELGTYFLGINCITFCNIFDNLALGILAYTADVSNMTIAELVKKSEYQKAGVKDKPVIKGFPAQKAEELEKLLEEYGQVFNVQVYVDDFALHSFIIYKKGDEWFIAETYPYPELDLYKVRSGIKLKDFLSNNPYLKMDIFLIDTSSIKPMRQSKSPKFFENLKKSVEQARQEYENFSGPMIERFEIERMFR